jgi:eukaryotic-like serine/threonine-protein kinase
MSGPQAPGGVICARCGTASSGGARFCGVCGAAMASTEPATRSGPAPRDEMIGREIAGRYRVLAKLGEGGMGAVFRAEQISLKRTIAVKLLRPDVSAAPALLRRFNAEAELVARLSHPNTVNIHDFGQDRDGTLFIAMELIDGRSLRQVIQREAPIPVPRALAIAAQIAASLADAHAHAIIHRDLKPDNVMLQDRGRERDVVRVLDFGIAKLRDDTRATHAAMTQQGDMLGTPQYMAPEQIRAEPIDGRTDLYALGCLLYEMVTARLPHEAQTVLAMLSKHLVEPAVPPSQRRPDLGIPAAVDALILGAMAKDPRARPRTMEAFGEQIAALRQRLGAEPTAPHAPAMAAPAAHPDAPYTGPGSAPVAYAPPSMPSPTPPPGTMPGAPLAAAYTPWPPGPAPGMGSAMGPPVGPAAGARRKAAIIAIAGVIATGAGIGALVLANRGPKVVAPAPEPVRLAEVSADAPPPADAPQAAVEPPPAPATDPWAPPPVAPRPTPSTRPRPAPAAPASGQRMSIGQGVQLVIPTGFQIAAKDNLVVAANPRGVLIAGGPIAIASNDPNELAQYHARVNHLVFDALTTVRIGGVQRPAAVFHATFAGVEVFHIAVALIGPTYRVAVAFQFPATLVKDAAIKHLVEDMFTRGILLP